MKDAVVWYQPVPYAARMRDVRPDSQYGAYPVMAAPAAAPPRSPQRSPRAVATATSRHSASVAGPPRRSDWTWPCQSVLRPASRLFQAARAEGNGGGSCLGGVPAWPGSSGHYRSRCRPSSRRVPPRVTKRPPEAHALGEGASCAPSSPTHRSSAPWLQCGDRAGGARAALGWAALGTKRHPRRGTAALRTAWGERRDTSSLNAP